MGTRGLVGIRLNDNMFGVYNHWDSYPSGLGTIVIDFIELVNKKNKWGLFKKRISELKFLGDNIKPTKAQKAKYLKYADLNVNYQSLSDWYCLLRKTHYGMWLFEVLKGDLKHIVDSIDFKEDSVFCEYAYVLDLDKMVIEFYDPPTIVGKYPFNDIPNNWIEEIFGKET